MQIVFSDGSINYVVAPSGEEIKYSFLICICWFIHSLLLLSIPYFFPTLQKS